MDRCPRIVLIPGPSHSGSGTNEFCIQAPRDRVGGALLDLTTVSGVQTVMAKRHVFERFVNIDRSCTSAMMNQFHTRPSSFFFGINNYIKEINAMMKQSCDGKTTDGSLLMFEETDRNPHFNTCRMD